ncbi:hypothetical protein OK074_5347 [Actinobacteria bacterium OK074]|nr:hypothetical protein OK074_5347 [Actinobacteria bacterium OK074]
MESSPNKAPASPQAELLRYRVTATQRVLSVLPLLFINILFALQFWTVGPATAELPPLATFCAAMLVLGVLLPSYFGVNLTPSAAVVHNFRRRTIPWADIQGIQIESILGARTVVLYEANGRRTRLRAPTTGFLAWDPGFEEKFHVIGGWWLEHRGPNWTPVPPPWAWWNGSSAPGGNAFVPPE